MHCCINRSSCSGSQTQEPRFYPLRSGKLAQRCNKSDRLGSGTKNMEGIEFQEFRQMINLELAWPAPVEHLQQFIVHLNRKGLAPGTIQGRLSALAFYAKIYCYSDHSGDYRIRKMIEESPKERGRVQDNRVLISPPLLECICKKWVLLCRDE